MHHHCLILTNVQIKVNSKFKELQTSYLMRLLTQRK